MLRTFQANWLLVVLAGGIALAGWSTLSAADPDTKDAAKKIDAPESKAKTENTPAAEKDPFAVPEGTPEELLKFIEKTARIQPQARSREDLVDFVKKTRHAMIAAADKILAAGADGKTRAKAVETKFERADLVGTIRRRRCREARQRVFGNDQERQGSRSKEAGQAL